MTSPGGRPPNTHPCSLDAAEPLEPRSSRDGARKAEAGNASSSRRAKSVRRGGRETKDGRADGETVQTHARRRRLAGGAGQVFGFPTWVS